MFFFLYQESYIKEIKMFLVSKINCHGMKMSSILCKSPGYSLQLNGFEGISMRFLFLAMLSIFTQFLTVFL